MALPAPVAEYSFDADTGADDSGNGHDLTVAGTFAAGHTGDGLAATGSTIGGSVDLTGPTAAASLCAWVNPDSLASGDTQAIVGLTDGVGNSEFVIFAQRADFGTSNVLQGNVRVGTSLGEMDGPALTAGVPAHVAMTYDGTTSALYLNGELVDSATRGGALHASEQLHCAGAPTVHSDMLVDDVRLYAVALTAEQVVEAMNTPAGGSSSTDVTVAGAVTAAETATPAGSVTATENVTVAGALTSQETATPAGSVSAIRSITVTGAVTEVETASPAGTVAASGSVTVAGEVTAVEIATPAGSVTTDGHVSIAGPVTRVEVSTPAGAVSSGSPGPGPVYAVGGRPGLAAVGSAQQMVPIG